MILSDGVNFMQAMLAVGLNGLVNCDPPEIDKNTIIKLLTYSCNTVANRRSVPLPFRSPSSFRSGSILCSVHYADDTIHVLESTVWPSFSQQKS